MFAPLRADSRDDSPVEARTSTVELQMPRGGDAAAAVARHAVGDVLVRVGAAAAAAAGAAAAAARHAAERDPEAAEAAAEEDAGDAER